MFWFISCQIFIGMFSTYIDRSRESSCHSSSKVSVYIRNSELFFISRDPLLHAIYFLLFSADKNPPPSNISIWILCFDFICSLNPPAPPPWPRPPISGSKQSLLNPPQWFYNFIQLKILWNSFKNRPKIFWAGDNSSFSSFSKQVIMRLIKGYFVVSKTGLMRILL